jgi:hypothetical protein
MRDAIAWNKRLAGKSAGWLDGHGYLAVRLTFNYYISEYRTHRIIWALTHRYWPFGEIGHINGIGDDNRLVNLRVTPLHAMQFQNFGQRVDNTSGYPGVHYDKQRNKWRAYITYDGHRYELGRFSTSQEAFAARCRAKRKYHLFEPEHRGMTYEQTIIATSCNE